MTFTPAPWPRRLRSQEWYGGTSRDTIYHRGWMKNQGYPHDLFDGRPIIGILNTWADLTPCNGHLRELAEKAACTDPDDLAEDLLLVISGELTMRLRDPDGSAGPGRRIATALVRAARQT